VVVFNPNNNMYHEIDEEKLAKKDLKKFWLNPTKNIDLCIKSKTPIRGHERPEKHVVSVYNEFLADLKPRLTIIAHSYGGVCTMALLNQKPEIINNLTCVAFTDAVHHVSKRDNPEIRHFLKEKGRNWVQSHQSLDAPESSHNESSGCVCVSAGTPSHEVTSSRCIKSLFKFVDENNK
jgi:hypothetical protein